MFFKIHLYALSLLFYIISAVSALPGIIYTINPSTIIPINEVEPIFDDEQ